MNDLELYGTATLANTLDCPKINFGQLVHDFKLRNAIIIVRDELGVELEIPFSSMELSTSYDSQNEVTIHGAGPITVLYPQGVQSKWN